MAGLFYEHLIDENYLRGIDDSHSLRDETEKLQGKRIHGNNAHGLARIKRINTDFLNY